MDIVKNINDDRLDEVEGTVSASTVAREGDDKAPWIARTWGSKAETRPKSGHRRRPRSPPMSRTSSEERELSFFVQPKSPARFGSQDVDHRLSQLSVDDSGADWEDNVYGSSATIYLRDPRLQRSSRHLSMSEERVDERVDEYGSILFLNRCPLGSRIRKSGSRSRDYRSSDSALAEDMRTAKAYVSRSRSPKSSTSSKRGSLFEADQIRLEEAAARARKAVKIIGRRSIHSSEPKPHEEPKAHGTRQRSSRRQHSSSALSEQTERHLVADSEGAEGRRRSSSLKQTPTSFERSSSSSGRRLSRRNSRVRFADQEDNKIREFDVEKDCVDYVVGTDTLYQALGSLYSDSAAASIDMTEYYHADRGTQWNALSKAVSHLRNQELAYEADQLESFLPLAKKIEETNRTMTEILKSAVSEMKTYIDSNQNTSDGVYQIMKLLTGYKKSLIDLRSTTEEIFQEGNVNEVLSGFPKESNHWNNVLVLEQSVVDCYKASKSVVSFLNDDETRRSWRALKNLEKKRMKDRQETRGEALSKA